MQYKAIIFDMDGTITDTATIWTQSTIDLIESKGISYTEEVRKEVYPLLHGLTVARGCKVIKDLFNLDHDVQDLINEHFERAHKLYENGIGFIEGFADFHAKVIQHGLRTGIATNADDKTLALSKRVLKLDTFFGKHIYNISHVNGICKPDPDVYLYAAKQLQIDPEYCIAIEDSRNGILSAKDAGMHCVGINTANNREHLEDAHQIIDRYDELNMKELIHRSQ